MQDLSLLDSGEGKLDARSPNAMKLDETLIITRARPWDICLTMPRGMEMFRSKVLREKTVSRIDIHIVLCTSKNIHLEMGVTWCTN